MRDKDSLVFLLWRVTGIENKQFKEAPGAPVDEYLRGVRDTLRYLLSDAEGDPPPVIEHPTARRTIRVTPNDSLFLVGELPEALVVLHETRSTVKLPPEPNRAELTLPVSDIRIHSYIRGETGVLEAALQRRKGGGPGEVGQGVPSPSE